MLRGRFHGYDSVFFYKNLLVIGFCFSEECNEKDLFLQKELYLWRPFLKK